MSLRRCSSGSVTFEMLVIFIPLFTIFGTLVQFAWAAQADLTVKSAALGAARSAVVILERGGNNPGPHGPESDVVASAALGLEPLLRAGELYNVRVRWADASSRADPQGRICVEVRSTFRCKVPFGNILICGGRNRNMISTACLPHQGARWIP